MTAPDAAFDAQPLRGRRIVVTRSADQARELLAQLQSAGATAISLPTIAFAPPADPAPLRQAIRGAAAGAYDGVNYQIRHRSFDKQAHTPFQKMRHVGYRVRNDDDRCPAR